MAVFSHACNDIVVNVKILLKCCQLTVHFNVECTTKILQCINNTFSQSMLMKCYIDNGCYRDAISLFQHSLLAPDDVSNTLFLKACTFDHHHYEQGQAVLKASLDNDVDQHSIRFLNTVIDFYAHYGEIAHAIDMFESIPQHRRDIVSIAAMMKCYVGHHRYADAIHLFLRSKHELEHDDVCHALFLKCCIHHKHDNQAYYEHGLQLIEQSDAGAIHRRSIQFMTTAIDFYGHFGRLSDAVQLFNSIPPSKKDIVCINAMLKHFAEHAQHHDDAMRLCNHCRPNDVTHMLLLKSCITSECFEDGARIIDGYAQRLPQRSIELINTAIHFYGHFGRVSAASDLFERIPAHKKDVVSVSVMMQCLVENAHSAQAIAVCRRHQAMVAHDAIVSLWLLKACKHGKDAAAAYETGHAWIEQFIRTQTCSKELLHTVIDFYAHFARVEEAVQVFESVADCRSNGALMYGLMKCFVENGEYGRAIGLFEQCGVMDHPALNTLFLQTCIKHDYFEGGKRLIQQSALLQLPAHDNVLFLTTVIDFWGEYGQIEDALHTFDAIPTADRDVIVYGAMMNALSSNQRWQEALQIFSGMEHEQRNSHCYSIALNACACAVSTEKGSEIIAELYRRPEETVAIILRDADVQSAMIRFYAKTRETEKAIAMFESMEDAILESDHSCSIYCAILDCYAKMGDMDRLFALFDRVRSEKRKIPDFIYNIVLNGCSHAGMVEQAWRIFEDIESTSRNGVSSQCMVAMLDCLARKPQLTQAQELYHTHKHRMSAKDKFVALTSILSSCRVHDDFVCAQRVFEEIQSTFKTRVHENKFMQDHMASSYVLMCNIYALHDDMDKESELRSEMHELNWI